MDAGFWNMGGYAAFVWGSYAAGALTLAWNVWSAQAEMRRVRRRLSEGSTDS